MQTVDDLSPEDQEALFLEMEDVMRDAGERMWAISGGSVSILNSLCVNGSAVFLQKMMSVVLELDGKDHTVVLPLKEVIRCMSGLARLILAPPPDGFEAVCTVRGPEPKNSRGKHRRPPRKLRRKGQR